MPRVVLTLKTAERDALVDLAIREHRDPRDQAVLIVVRELQRERLLPSSSRDEPCPVPAESADGRAD